MLLSLDADSSMEVMEASGLQGHASSTFKAEVDEEAAAAAEAEGKLKLEAK